MKGTCHTEDFPLLFKTKCAPRFKAGHDNYKAQQAFLNFFMTFARDGSLANWSQLKQGKDVSCLCMEIRREEWSMKELTNIEKLRVWDSLYNKIDLT